MIIAPAEADRHSSALSPPQAWFLATLVFNVTLTGVIGDASGQGRSLERATLVIETGEIRRAPITFLRRHLAPVSEEGFTPGGSYAVGKSPPSLYVDSLQFAALLFATGLQNRSKP